LNLRAVKFLAAIFGLAVGAAPSVGTVVTIAFSGELTSVADGFTLSYPIEVGTPFSGLYSFDPDSASDAIPSDPRVGSYSFPSGYMAVEVGDNAFQSSGGILVAVLNDIPGFNRDLYQATMGSLTSQGILWHAMGLDFESLDSGPFASDALLTTAPDLNDFGFRRSFLGLEQGVRDPRFVGEVTWIAQVPEPGALALLGTGVLLCVQRNRGRARRALR